MPKKQWSEIRKGDRVELGGKTWDVLRAKTKGKKVEVTVESGKQRASSVVKAKDIVKVPKPGKLHGPAGEQTRWATKSEHDKALDPKLEAGNPKITAPPEPTSGDPWETPRDRIEAKLDDLLSARLVAETPDTAAGYYVPPIDVSTVAAHLRAFHGVKPGDFADEKVMLEVHREAHKAGGPFDVNHWHTKDRPEIGS